MNFSDVDFSSTENYFSIYDIKIVKDLFIEEEMEDCRDEESCKSPNNNL